MKKKGVMMHEAPTTVGSWGVKVLNPMGQGCPYFSFGMGRAIVMPFPNTWNKDVPSCANRDAGIMARQLYPDT